MLLELRVTSWLSSKSAFHLDRVVCRGRNGEYLFLLRSYRDNPSVSGLRRMCSLTKRQPNYVSVATPPSAVWYVCGDFSDHGFSAVLSTGTTLKSLNLHEAVPSCEWRIRTLAHVQIAHLDSRRSHRRLWHASLRCWTRYHCMVYDTESWIRMQMRATRCEWPPCVFSRSSLTPRCAFKGRCLGRVGIHKCFQ